MGAASAANTGAAGAMHRVGFFAGKPAPTGYADRLRIQGVRPGMSETRQ
ncbi:diguanylate cyclase [Pseudomonas putida]|nr:diguanylate cyclase [Pseudomonas putida]